MCSCTSELRSIATVRATNHTPAPAPTVRVTYVGRTPRLVRGPGTGAGYAAYPDETLSAHPRDVAGLVSSGWFEVRG
jgi:hypothetical protein